MTTKREQILAKVKTILTTTTGINKRIFRNRVEPFAREESPSIVVEFSSDNPSLRNRDFIDWTLAIRVIVICSIRIQTQKLMLQLKAYIQS